MTNLLIATRNAHKATEIQAILGTDWNCLTLRDLAGAPEVVENAPTFAGNATNKAVELAQWLAAHATPRGLVTRITYVLADDSGLEVDVLDGAPGVHSARFAALENSTKGNSPDALNNAKLLRLMANVPEAARTARFRCVLALTHVPGIAIPNASPTCCLDEAEAGVRLYEGVCEGQIAFEPQGTMGFGYDPLFVPRGLKLSFAELGEEMKNRISHRSKALQALRRGWTACEQT